MGATGASSRTALVVGGARGCGRAVAIALAREGADVAICDIGTATYQSLDYVLATAAEMEETAERVRVERRAAVTVVADIRDAAAVKMAVARVEAELGPITDLVVTAGVSSVAPLAEMTRAMWDEVVATNVTGAFNVIQRVLPGMVARGHGCVVLVCGSEARRGAASLSHVSAAGWALIGMAKSIALEVAASGVTVNVIATGPVGSPLLLTSESHQRLLASATPWEGTVWERIAASHPQARPHLEPGEVADAVTFLMSAKARPVTGAVLDVSLGLAGRNSA